MGGIDGFGEDSGVDGVVGDRGVEDNTRIAVMQRWQ